MIKLLEQAVAEIEKLPEETQDAIAARLLADLADEKAWAARLSATAEDQWERMAALVRQEIGPEDTISFGDVFPASTSRT